jgi:CheY-like chemotaxis protein
MNEFLQIQPSIPLPTVKVPRQQPFTCLVAEDDPDDQEIFLLAVETTDLACECIFVPDGIVALTILEQSPLRPDCIFLDLNMPRLSGLQCLQLLKENPRLKSIPVVIYSTSSDTAFREEALRLGAEAFLSKPSRISDFTHQLNSLFLNLTFKG